ncbi:MAG: hypothetical protein KGQ46_07995 [Hyphomicrobiales bacterium]|nr:hypothetical protein [Hyphomicrobiales bacterium]MDE2115742.1 hypothetical protein [Hyphomicrobiales bacterium]
MRNSSSILSTAVFVVLLAFGGAAMARPVGDGAAIFHKFHGFRHHHQAQFFQGERPVVPYYPPQPYYPPVYSAPPVYSVEPDYGYPAEGFVPPPYSPYGRHTMANYCVTQVGHCTLPGPEFAGRHCTCYFPGYGKMSGQSVP